MTTPGLSRFGSTWALLLAGPVIGTTYFFVVYLLAEATCANGVKLLSQTALRVVIVAAAAGSVAVFVTYALQARRLWSDASDNGGQRGENQRFMVTTGLMLLGLFVLFVLFLAAPAIGSSLC